MNNYITRNGDYVIVDTIDENGRKDKKILDNQNNISELLENENRLAEIKKYAGKAVNKYNKLVTMGTRAKLLNKLFIVAGIVGTTVMSLVSANGFGFLPCLFGGAISLAPMLALNTIGKAHTYNQYHDSFKRERDFYMDELKKETTLNERLKREARPTVSYGDRRALGYTEYVIKYKDSTAVAYMKKHGYTDKEINDHFKRIKREIESTERFNEEFENTKGLRLTK